jgi:hypothetical protein
VHFKHCSFGSPHDQVDKLEEFIRTDKYSPECFTTRNT